MNNGEMPSVRGQDMPNLKPFRNCNNQSIDKADILVPVFFQYFFRADKITVPEMFYNQLFFHQGTYKTLFRVLSKVGVKQIAGLRQHRVSAKRSINHADIILRNLTQSIFLPLVPLLQKLGCQSYLRNIHLPY